MSSQTGRFRTLNRRHLLKLGVVSASAAALAPIPQVSAAPKKGGHLILAIDGASVSNTLDPATINATYPQVLGYQWGNGLVELDEAGIAKPELAESWDVDKTGRHWNFKLRKGVEFHNGKTFTAPDVVSSLNHHRSESSKSGARSLLGDIEEIKASTLSEVTFVLKSPNADFPYTLADYHLLIFADGEDPALGIGTGPFSMERFEPGQTAHSVRNANYWKDGRGHVDSVETIATNDLTARTSALLSQSVHFINRISPTILSRIEGSGGYRIWNVPGSGHYTFQTMIDVPPFNNLDFRLALKHAIDRDAILKVILNGHGRIGNDVPIPSFDRYFAHDLPQRTYDPDRVGFHLKRAGSLPPATLNISEIAFAGAVDAAQLYEQQAARAGLTLKINRAPSDGYWSNVWMKEPFSGSYSAGRPTPDLMLTSAYHSSAAWNDTHFNRQDFDDLLGAARAEQNDEKRKQMYRDLQFIIYEQGGTILPVFNNYIFAASKKVNGLSTSPIFSGMRVAEQLYFV